MKVTEECYGCLQRLVHQAANLATTDEKMRSAAINDGLEILSRDFSLDQLSIAIATNIHKAIKEMTHNPDPYAEMKQKEIAVSKEIVEMISVQYGQQFIDLLRFAALGNSIDFFRPLDEVIEQMKKPIELAIDDSKAFEEKIIHAKKVMYLADNTGEAFFDLPLVKLLKQSTQVIYAVKGTPVQNDLTLDDLKKMNIDHEFGKVITTGTPTPGVIMEWASKEFRESFESADLIIAKGMGYYEGLSELPAQGHVLHCLMTKCIPVTISIGVPLGSYVAFLR